jgi:hypothetical protein
MILKVDEKLLADKISRIYHIKKQIRLLEKNNNIETKFLIEKTLQSLKKLLKKERLDLSNEIEYSMERLI